MYKLGQRPHHKQGMYALLILLFAGLVIFGIWFVSNYFKSDTELGESDGITRGVDVDLPATKHVDNRIFSIDIPKSWKQSQSKLQPAAQYSWQGTTKDDTARTLDIYLDTKPQYFPLNRLMPVKASGNRMVAIDTVSDNCVDFTDKSQMDPRTGRTLAKWADVSFYCDTFNPGRNVVGTSSAGSINSVALDGSATGLHRFFLVYTDHTAQPDFEIFSNVISSLRVH